MFHATPIAPAPIARVAIPSIPEVLRTTPVYAAPATTTTTTTATTAHPALPKDPRLYPGTSRNTRNTRMSPPESTRDEPSFSGTGDVRLPPASYVHANPAAPTVGVNDHLDSKAAAIQRGISKIIKLSDDWNISYDSTLHQSAIPCV